MKSKAKVSVVVTLNGHEVKIQPDTFTVQDGDEIRLSYTIDLPIVQREGTIGDVVIVREVIRPRIEA
jgi:hypothetical protein